MPRKRGVVTPAYSFHASGQAVVQICHRDYYLGKHGSPESYARYAELIAEYKRNGFNPPEVGQRQDGHAITVAAVVEDFRSNRLPFYE